MKTLVTALRRWPACWLLLFSLSAPLQAAEWLQLQSKHFNLTAAVGERSARAYVEDLEALHHVLMLMLGVDTAKASPKPRFDILLLSDPKDMARIRPHFENRMAGVYMACRDGAAAVARHLGSRQGSVDDPGLKVLFHEYAHHVMAQYANRYHPAWYVEGFAEYLGNSMVEGERVALGEMGRHNAWWLGSRPWIDFAYVLKPPFVSTGAQDLDDDRIHAFYRQSWLLTHYMLSDSGRVQKFNDYFARIGAGEDPLTSFEPATGIPLDKLAGVLRRHMGGLPVNSVSTKGMDAGDITVTRLPAGTDRHVLEAVVLRTCPPKEQGQAILKTLRALDAQGPDRMALHLALARAELRFGEAEAAVALLQALLAPNEDHFEAQHLMALAKLALADNLDGEARTAARAEARAHLFKAYRLKKNDAPNLYQMAWLLSSGGVTPNALNAAQGARALMPLVVEYATLEALLDVDAGERDRAVKALTPLTSNPHAPALAANARRAIEAIRAGQPRAEVQNLLNAKP